MKSQRGPSGQRGPQVHETEGKNLFPFKETNLWNKSLISADRSNKATLLLTILRSLFKSSAKDLSSPISQVAIRRLVGTRFRDPLTLPVKILDAHELRLFVIV